MKIFDGRPEVSIENFPEAFEYYDQRGPNPAFARLGHFVMSTQFHPRITMTEMARSDAAWHIERGTTTIVVMKHINDLDQYNLASCVQLVPELHGLRGNISIMGKIKNIFDKPGVVGTMQRYAVDALGTLPTVRQKDEKEDATEAEKAARRLASDLSLLLPMNKTARDGLNLALFPEKGGREEDDGDPTVVRELSHGLFDIYANLRQAGRDVVVIPIGQYVGHDGLEKQYKSPDMVVGRPVEIRTHDSTEFNELVRNSMQFAVSQAVAQRHQFGLAA